MKKNQRIIQFYTYNTILKPLVADRGWVKKKKKEIGENKVSISHLIKTATCSLDTGFIPQGTWAFGKTTQKTSISLSLYVRY